MSEKCLRPDCNMPRVPEYIWGGYCSEDCVIRHELDIANATVKMLHNSLASSEALVMMLRRLIVAHYRERGWDQGDETDKALWTMADAQDWALWIHPDPPESE